MPLEEYRRKRDRRRTPEPVPESEPTSGGNDRFVVQEHHATALHWDLRLERDGVLASWAVPKGLPEDSETVRMAVRTEDHPLEYLDFHGEIPRGEYGGGRMSVWDSGRYDTEKWNDREVAFVLHGERARGRFVLLHRPGERQDRWLLRRTREQPATSAPSGAPLPRDAALAVATPAKRLPSGDDWRVRPVFGGRRVLVRSDGGRLTLCPAGDDGVPGEPIPTPGPLRELGPALGAGGHLLDAELTGGGELWIADVLHTAGRDARPLPLDERRALLEDLRIDGPQRRVVPLYPNAGEQLLAAVRAQGLPGVVAVREGSAYPQPGSPSDDWREVRVSRAGQGSTRPAAPRTGHGRASLSNPDKVLYPATGTTKADVLGHYLAVAEAMLPHIEGRPATLKRWPDGVESSSFFEKNVSRHAPAWLRTARVGTPGGRSESADFAVIGDAEGLAWAANLAALELHVPQWRLGPRDGRHPPDRVVFDLDPGEGATIVDCCRVALRLRALLEEHGLAVYPSTSGGKGMQLYLPVRVTELERTSEFAREVAERLAAEHPRETIAVMTRARRRGKVFVDWSQNNTAKTTIASYSLRGRERPTVATPVTWDEVAACREAEDLVFTHEDLPARLERHGDLMRPLLDTEGFRLPRGGAIFEVPG
ncbi:non-homologous end-joining DNA ligase [Pseudonocardia parietis]|uniref:Bifunctional non-homologous end joining protein LigD n=1 Tax=Pseudonocardia parietis TaxID=570936 RepID=A0ABS4VWV3_9PSEU|nr:non-homologous end-joining DNA ligase [Pseudonocardia parietis]MBP2368276.1 bifunctional non-homologous end joining protein LigD [Pseudonocardia parietis]